MVQNVPDINIYRPALYCKHVIFSVYDIWPKTIFQQVTVDLNWRFSECANSKKGHEKGQ